jgi:hypothetical protein
MLVLRLSKLALLAAFHLLANTLMSAVGILPVFATLALFGVLSLALGVYLVEMAALFSGQRRANLPASRLTVRLQFALRGTMVTTVAGKDGGALALRTLHDTVDALALIRAKVDALHHVVLALTTALPAVGLALRLAINRLLHASARSAIREREARRANHQSYDHHTEKEFVADTIHGPSPVHENS